MTSPSAINTGKQTNRSDATAILALTRRGTELAARIGERMPGSTCFCNSRYAMPGMTPMLKMADTMAHVWSRFNAVVCVMGCGIVVRTLAPLLDSKLTDPAVIVMDEAGKFAISLVSGHLGGANELARKVAGITGGQAVITTASDLQDKIAVDLIAQRAGLRIENPRMLSRAAAAVLDDEPLWLYDPHELFTKHLPAFHRFQVISSGSAGDEGNGRDLIEKNLPRLRAGLGIWVSELIAPPRVTCLRLRPASLVLGIGCNRGTAAQEIIGLVEQVLEERGLSPLSIKTFASVDLKSDEAGLIEAARYFKSPILFFKREEIQSISVPNPSRTVARHIGVESVCEASAMLSAGSGKLLVSKRKSKNCTLAIARASCS